MTMLEKKIDALLRVATAEDEVARTAAVVEAKTLLRTKDAEGNRKQLTDCIEDFMLEIGVSPYHFGFGYIVEALRLCYEDASYIKAITSRLYPAIAQNMNTTAPRVERGIRHAIETMYERTDIDILDKYFKNITDPNKGKATNSEFLARMHIEVVRRMR